MRPRARGPGAGVGDAGGAGASGWCSAGGAGASGWCSAGGGGVGAARAGAGGGANDAAGTGADAGIMHFGVPTAVPLCRAKTHRNTYTILHQHFMPAAIQNLRPKGDQIHARSDPKFTPEVIPHP